MRPQLLHVRLVGGISRLRRWLKYAFSWLMNCFKKSFWPWKLSDTVAHEDGKRNTIVWCFFCMSGSSKLHGMGSESNISVLERLIGEEERLRWLVDGMFEPEIGRKNPCLI